MYGNGLGGGGEQKGKRGLDKANKKKAVKGTHTQPHPSHTPHTPLTHNTTSPTQAHTHPPAAVGGSPPAARRNFWIPAPRSHTR